MCACDGLYETEVVQECFFGTENELIFCSVCVHIGGFLLGGSGILRRKKWNVI